MYIKIVFTDLFYYCPKDFKKSFYLILYKKDIAKIGGLTLCYNSVVRFFRILNFDFAT